MEKEKKILLIKAFNGLSLEQWKAFAAQGYAVESRAVDFDNEQAIPELVKAIQKNHYDAAVIVEPNYLQNQEINLQPLCEQLTARRVPTLISDSNNFHQPIASGLFTPDHQVREQGMKVNEVITGLDTMLGIKRVAPKASPTPPEPAPEATVTIPDIYSQAKPKVLILAEPEAEDSPKIKALRWHIKHAGMEPFTQVIADKGDIQTFCESLKAGDYAGAIVTNYQDLKRDYARGDAPKQNPLEDLMASLCSAVAPVIVYDLGSKYEQFTQSAVLNMSGAQTPPGDVVDTIAQQLDMSLSAGRT